MLCRYQGDWGGKGALLVLFLCFFILEWNKKAIPTVPGLPFVIRIFGCLALDKDYVFR